MTIKSFVTPQTSMNPFVKAYLGLIGTGVVIGSGIGAHNWCGKVIENKKAGTPLQLSEKFITGYLSIVCGGMVGGSIVPPLPGSLVCGVVWLKGSENKKGLPLPHSWPHSPS
jgi:hypothetical protein